MACYLFLITVQKKKNAGFTHFTTWINIKTIFSEKYPYRKGHTDPIFAVCFKSIKFVQITENLSNILKKKKKDGKKNYIHTIEQLLKGKWGCGLHYSAETKWCPDFGDYVEVLQENAPTLNKTHRVI